MVQILFQVEEGVEEDGGHWARPKIRQANHVGALRTDHIQHLKKPQGQEDTSKSTTPTSIAGKKTVRPLTHQAAAITKYKKLHWVCGYQIPNGDIKSHHWKVKMKSPTSLFLIFGHFSDFQY